MPQKYINLRGNKFNKNKVKDFSFSPFPIPWNGKSWDIKKQAKYGGGTQDCFFCFFNFGILF